MSFTDFNGANTYSNSANQIQSSLSTNFNVLPYYDDYDPAKEYYRILFKPGYSVQARELTQLQTMIQSQIKRFGTNIYKDGSIIIPGAFNIRSNYGDVKGNPLPYVKIKNTTPLGNTVNVQTFIGQTVTGASSNISAQVITVLDTDGTSTNTKTLYVQYLTASSANSQQRVFPAGETLTIANTITTAIVLDNDPVANTGYASWFEISEGVFFAKDHFIYFPTQSTILERYNPNPSSLVGFYVYEDIVTSSTDSSLLDPALQSSNYGAPGADRLRLDPELTVLPYGTTPPADFITLFAIANGNIQILNDQTQFNSINDAMAQRMYDVDGDFVVSGLGVQLQEHENNGVNNGRYTPAQGGNTDLLITSVSAGRAYVKGYSLTNPGKYDITITKPLDYQNVGIQVSSTAMGQYVTVNEFVGTWYADVGSRVYFYDTPNQRITNGGAPYGQKWSTGAVVGNQIGSAIVSSVEYVSGTKGYDAVYNVYLTDITMNSGYNFSQVLSLYYIGSGAHSGADIVGATFGTANTVIQATYPQPLLYYVGSSSTKTVRNVDGGGSVTYYYNQTGSSLSLTTFGNVSLTIATGLSGTQTLPYGNGYLSETEIADDIILTYQASTNIGPLWGGATVSTLGSACTTIHGVSTYFTYLNVGDKVEITGLSNTYYITAIANDSVMTLSAPVPATVTTNSIFKAYKTGDIANLNGVGVRNGLQRVVIATPTTLLIDMQEGYSNTVPVTVTYRMATEGIQEVPKTLTPGRYVLISVGSHPNGITGPYPLGFSDVYKIRNVIRKSGSQPTSLNDGTDVTSYFKLDNGQRDTMYDTASIVPIAGFVPGASDYLLVYFDYFLPNFGNYSGYFTIDSYNIDDFTVPTPTNAIRTEQIPIYISPSYRKSYDLRNYLDFRPVKLNIANDVTSASSPSLSVNPIKSTSFYYSNELFFPVPSTQLTYSYSYYLGRQDVLVGNKNGVLSVLKGTPAVTPVPPTALDTQMAIAIISLAPYPSLSPAYGNLIGRQDLACSVQTVSTKIYTMRDLGILDNRISNLEYYASLTLLESSAINMNITNANGLNRFKNGIFVDNFKDSSSSAILTNPDMRISFDPIELCIRPIYSSKPIYYDYLGGSETVMSNGKITFTYTENQYFSQPWVTRWMNLERNAYYYVGRMTLNPSDDVWVDTQYAPDQYVNITSQGALIDVTVGTGPAVPVSTAVQTTQWLGETWGAWTQFITGYTVYGTGWAATNEPSKTFSTYADAASYVDTWVHSYGKGGATIVQTTENDRIGASNFVTYQSGQAVGGYNVIDTSIIPYIQPQDIIVNVSNLKPNSRMYSFFDTVHVDAYCTPLTEEQFNAVSRVNTYTTAGVQNPQVSTLLSTSGWAKMGDPLIVNPDGTLYFSFKIFDTVKNPGTPKFQTGQRVMLIQDDLALNPGTLSVAQDVTTWAQAYFFAQGTQQTLQETVYSTNSVQYTSTPLQQSYLSYANTTIVNTTPPPYSCFNPEAKVLMADKTWKPISDVNIGEKVIGANGDINTVMKSRTINVGDRKMVKFQEGFYATDDHIFLTDKGWKTWDPKSVIRKNGTNQHILEGENREEGIDPLDKLKIVDMESDDKINFKFVDYKTLGTEIVDFDPDYTVYDLTLSGDSTYIVEGYVVHNCCMAYNVNIKVPSDEEGVYCLGYDVFVQAKSATRDLWFEIRTLDAAGQITNTQLPGSYVYIKNADIPVSTNGINNPLQIRFPYPVFLNNNRSYAFTIHGTAGAGGLVDPDTYLWVAQLGQQDRNNGASFNNRQQYGNFYFTNDNITWNLITDTDLTINVYTATFNQGVATCTLGEQGIEKWYLSDVSASFGSLINDHFVSGDTLTLSGVSGTITVGDTLTGNVSGATAAGQLISVSGSNYQTSNTRYQLGEKVTATSGGQGIVAGIANNSAVLTFYNDNYSNVYVEMSHSTGGFKVGDWIQDTRSGGYAFHAKITDILNYTYSGAQFQPDILNFTKTGSQYAMDTYQVGALSDNGYVNVTDSSATFFKNEMQIYSKSLESSALSGNRSNKVQVQFESNSIYTSPLLDLSSTYSVLIDNLVNADATGETNPRGGSALNKYISETITLAPGQAANDLNVYLTNYRPPGTDILVYCKLMNQYDTDNFDNKPWILMPYQGNSGQVYSSASDTSNYIDFSYVLPTSVLTGPSGEFQYTLNGTTYTNFQYFAIKIVLLANNPASVPKASELRAIALQL